MADEEGRPSIAVEERVEIKVNQFIIV